MKYLARLKQKISGAPPEWGLQKDQKPPFVPFVAPDLGQSRKIFDPDAFEERAPIVEFEAGFPRTWAEGFARLDPNHTPPGVPLKRWRRFVGDVGVFLESWAAEAAALGWGPEDLFGAHPQKPFERVDYQGLLWLLDGARVVMLTEDTAAIEKPSGARQTFRRKPHVHGRVMAWELGA